MQFVVVSFQIKVKFFRETADFGGKVFAKV